ncbi:methyltransferase-like protein [Leptomonas pyrrhocoris]|uniref:Methyltransferase-like protein n=1 Tax=Leptomonas pyrrhocoris TaxID=157538 RepID=A0A0N0DWY7_LEPPY|nr:methyltransferase-like protein [Leptomonas pyrrhocoris]KPA82348.1 methyltransferase-like protein [Leptomonas pyrrhocoris]|eukprot:XP_015660787.1 methyltransferase-like protein [Leptomonas pyrrhocoris]
MPATRPELENPPEVFYNASEARKYTVSTRVRKIQRDMTLRALELLSLPKDEAPTGLNRSALLLDIGCGSGLSGDVLTEQGHAWMGVDISMDMLRIAKEDELNYYDMGEAQRQAAKKAESTLTSSSNLRMDTSHVKWGLITSEEEDNEGEDDERDEEGTDKDVDDSAEGQGETWQEGEEMDGLMSGPRVVEVLRNDIGAGLPFRPGTFDGCISISVLQWLCHSTKKGEVPQRRLLALFQSLYNSLRRGAKAVLQFYPSDPTQVHMITHAAMKCGFNGGVVVDYPNSARAKKYYLVLQAGQVAGGFVPPPALTTEAEDDADEEDSEYEGEEEYHGSDDDDDDGAGGPFRDPHSRKRVHVGGRDTDHHHKRARASSAHGHKRRRKDNRPETGSRDWVLLKKEERRRRGYTTSADSKYTMRQRKPRF